MLMRRIVVLMLVTLALGNYWGVSLAAAEDPPAEDPGRQPVSWKAEAQVGHTVVTSQQSQPEPKPTGNSRTPWRKRTPMSPYAAVADAALKGFCIAAASAGQPCTNPRPTITGNNKTLDPIIIVRKVATNVVATAPKPDIGPDIAFKRWNFIPVGYPVWLTATTTSEPKTATITQDGLTITVRPGLPTYTWDMGDGTTIKCKTMTRWRKRADERILPSPDCGHMYQKMGDYQVRLTTTYPVRWSVANQSGLLDLTVTSTTTIPVGELHAVVVNTDPNRRR